MLRNTLNSRGAASCLLVALLFLSGCGKDDRPERYPVTGTVKFSDGKPLVGGLVIFRSAGEKQQRSRGRVEPDGTYHLSTFERHDGALVGKHQAMVMPLIDRTDGPPTVPIHKDLQKFKTSGLEFEVTPEGPNEFDIEVYPPKRRR